MGQMVENIQVGHITINMTLVGHIFPTKLNITKIRLVSKIDLIHIFKGH